MISRCSAAIALESRTASSSCFTRMTAPNPFHEARAIDARGKVASWDFHRAFDVIGERHVVGDQDRLCVDVVFGLRQQIGRDPAGIAGAVSDDEHFRGTGDHVDADLAEHQPLGGGDIGIAGTDDLCHRRDGR